MPAGMNIDILFDRSQPIRESIHDVKFTLVLSIVFMYLMPGGVMGLVRKISSMKGRRERPERLVVSEGKTEGV